MPNHSRRRSVQSAKPGGVKKGSGWRSSGPKGRASWRGKK